MIWTTRKLVFIGCCEALGCKTDECDEYHESKKPNGLLQQTKCRLNFVVFSEDWGENTEENNLVSVLFWGNVSCKSLIKTTRPFDFSYFHSARRRNAHAQTL
jgi:hypothetical protein